MCSRGDQLKLCYQATEDDTDCNTRLSPLASAAMPRRAVKWNELPFPSSLSTQIRPPSISVNRCEIVRPSPVPPYLRVVELSAWVKEEKISFCLSGAMPMPVSW